MEASSVDLSVRLSKYSINRAWDPYTTIAWPDALDRDSEYFMSPELMSLYGTDVYDGLSEVQRRRLSFYEIGNFFSFVLLGERPVVSGMMDRMYRPDTMGAISDYLHHFVDEENKHMVMFSRFCNRYLGKVYPEKKLVFERDYVKGEEDLVFYCKVLIVEELGDFYNYRMRTDDRINSLVREINDLHHRDETRHLAFGRAWAVELFERYASNWEPARLAAFQNWLSEYFTSAWTDFYNPAVYRDAGLGNGYELRQMALKHPACKAFREEASDKLVQFLIKHRFLAGPPSL